MKDLEHNVGAMQSPQDLVPPFLEMQFSLYKEKRNLYERLQFGTFGTSL
jgi:hypothetical protein